MKLLGVKISAKNFEETRMSLNQQKHKMTLKLDFWSIEGGFIYRHHVELRVHLHVLKEESFPMSLKYIDVVVCLQSAEGNWKGDFLFADIEELEKMHVSEIYPRRINAKEVLTSQKETQFHIPIADGPPKLCGRKTNSENPL